MNSFFPELQDKRLNKNGDLVVFIIYATTCDRVSYMTHQNQEKYTTYAKRTKEAIEERFPMVRVYLKSTEQAKHHPTILDHYS